MQDGEAIKPPRFVATRLRRAPFDVLRVSGNCKIVMSTAIARITFGYILIFWGTAMRKREPLIYNYGVAID